MDFLKIDSDSYTPVYIQIQDGIKHAIESGVLKPGQQLPSVREFARSLKLNPNTVTKALNNLVTQGVINTRQGLGCFVAGGHPGRNVTNSDRSAVGCLSGGAAGHSDGDGGIGQYPGLPEKQDYTPTYIRIRDDLLSKILDGSFPAHSKLSTINEIALEYGVNTNTVVKALNTLKQRGYVSSTRGVGYEVNESVCYERFASSVEPEESETEIESEPSDDEVDPTRIVSPFDNDESPPETPSPEPESDITMLIRSADEKETEFVPSVWHPSNARELIDAGSLLEEQIQASIFMAVAAFLNTDGGNVLVGVNKKREVVGVHLEDFTSPDEFLSCLERAIEKRIGQGAFASISLDLHAIGALVFCKITCEQSREPVFLSSDEGREEFYVRVGPLCVALKPSQIHEYISYRYRRGG